MDSDEANKSIKKTSDNAEGMSSKLFDGIGTAVKWGEGLALAAGAAAAAVGISAVNMSDDLKKALNGIQASTGAESMVGMRDAMLDIYNNNFGDSFEDIGASMQTIAQQTKQTGKELADTTKNALSIKDTFGIDVSESIRGVNQLIKNFGITGEEAYNFIAQGAQGGLNANENLADSINEYSGHFANIGLSATDMFNMLKNGADSGVFDIDKLGDAIKEFGIRTKDGSDTTSEAFTRLGLDATKISNDFAAGGERGKAAFELVTNKLNEMKDPLEQNKTGTELFGTMWEDVGAKGIAALTSTKGSIDKNIDALGKINEVKYDTFGEAMTGIKRNLETSILIPLGDKILPILSEFADWIIQNMPVIKEKIGIAMDFVAEAFDKVSEFINSDLSPQMEILSEWFKFISDEVVPKFGATFQEWIPLIFEVFQEMWLLLKPQIDFFVEAFQTAFPIIKLVISGAIDNIKVVITGLLTVLKGVIQFVSGVFSGDWNKAWEGIKNIFSGVWNGLSGIVKNAANSMISMVNMMINSLNKLRFAFPDWVPGMGGKSFSLNIDKIPQLAKGGNIGDDGAVMVGERGPEILSNIKGAKVTPLDKSKNGLIININNPTIMNDRDADRLGDLLVRRLKTLGVT